MSPRASITGPRREHERGIALVMALMVLLAISLLSVALMMTLQIEKKLTGEQSRYAKCLNLAEAGVAEAMSRIRNGDIPSNGANPRMCAQVFLAPAGSLPNYVNTDSIPLPTGQPATSQLTYSTSGKSADALTITYKTDPAQTVIYRYDGTKNPPINYLSGLPIYVIRATGRVGTTSRRVQAEVIQKPVNMAIKGAMAVNTGVDFGGSSGVCGYNHRADTPLQTPGTHDDPPGTCLAGGWETGMGNLPGAWSANSITSSGSAGQAGFPIDRAANQIGFYSGPWEAVGLTQAEFFSWVGAPRTIMPAPMKGIFYIDNNNISQDATGAWSAGGVDGEGLLYVDGDLTLNSNFTFKGLIYVEGDLKINGNSWVLGALIVKGKGRIANGGCVVLYSSDAIQQNIAKYGGQFSTLSWREAR